MPEQVAEVGIAPTEAVPQTVTPDATAAPEQTEQPAERTFTQKELDDILEKRLRKEARKYERILDKVVSPKEAPPKQETPTGEPKRENFSDYEAYIEARAEWKADQKFAEREAKAAEAKKQQEAEKRIESWRGKLKSAADEIKDLHETLEEAETPMSQAMFDAIVESDIGPKVAYYLAKHADEAERIAGLSPASQIREIGKIEAKLTSSPPPTKQTSQAPAPIEPVGGKASASDEPSDKDSTEEWVRKREAQLRAKRKR